MKCNQDEEDDGNVSASEKRNIIDFSYDAHLLGDANADPIERDREWSRVVNEFDPRLRSYFAGRTRNRAELEELISHIWRKAQIYLPQLESTHATWSWLLTVGRNRLKDRYRAAGRAEGRTSQLHAEAALLEELSLKGPTVLDELAKSDSWSDRDRPIDKETWADRWNMLSEAEQVGVTLHVVEGMTHAEIALQIGDKADAVRKRYSRAMRLLRTGDS